MCCWVEEHSSEGGDDDEEDHRVLGHLSMLLGIQVSPCGRYVLTSDRDEKIRVSHYPNSYSIHGYCLGHTEFVSAMKLLPGSRIVTGSGDGTIKTWNYADCKLIFSREPWWDGGVTLPKPGPDADAAAAAGGGAESKLRRSKYPGVKSIKCSQIHLAVQIEA